MNQHRKVSSAFCTSILMMFSLIAIGATQFAWALPSVDAKETDIPICTVEGPENASVTIQEFADFECPFCAKGNSTLNKVAQDFPGKVKIVLRQAPLPFHQNALPAAKAAAAICLQSPNLAGRFKDELYAEQNRLTKEGEKFIFEIAEKIGANVDQMKADMKGSIVAKMIKEDQNLAKQKGIKGTPSFLIGKQLIVGAQSYSEFKKVIEQELAP